jgi:hypothetical protein
VLYLYAITESPTEPDLAGLRRAPLRAVGEEGLFAIVSEHEDLEIRAAEDDLWSHEGVVEALMDRGSVLPVRLGSVMTDEAAVLRSLRERRRELELALQRVRGAVELGVRVAMRAEDLDEPPCERAAETTGPGTAYIQARLRRERRGRDLAARIHEPLASLARASTLRLSAPERPMLNAAYLVDRGRIEDFTARVEELDAHSEAMIVCTGPWPPYSFSSAETGR